MVKKLDAKRIEKARNNGKKILNRRQEEKLKIQETIQKNRKGERKGTVILPTKKLYAYQESPKIRVAAYARVSTAEEAQVGSFEMQIQHFKAVIESNPNYELVEIYSDEGVSGTSINKRTGFQKMISDAKNHKIEIKLAYLIQRI